MSSLNPETRERIETLIKSDRVVLFMKGTPQQPQCGFSAATVGILDGLVPSYTTVNVLEDQSVREGIKAFSDWPTIPQLYLDQEFVGGCDIVREMYNAGELHEALGLPAPDRTPPAVTITDEAAEIIRSALESQPGMAVHVSIDSRWNHNLNLGPATGHEVRASDNGVELRFDLGSAARARGLRLAATDSFQGRSLTVENPNAPPPVQPMSGQELHAALERGDALELLDVRDPEERARASLPGSRLLDEETLAAVAGLPKDTRLVLYCHLGQRSQAAAEHFRSRGFTDVHNLVGGIDAWSREVDPSVPRY